MPTSRIAQAVLLTCCLISANSWARTSLTAPLPRPLPPILQVAQAKIPVQIKELTIQSEIQGKHVTSVLEYRFYNPNQQILEGQLEFPLADGQIVSGFALDIAGQLRDAVAVPKDKAQQVFEDISRRRIDPGLLEKTQGNNYRIRVYPLPAGGERRVQITVQHDLIQREQLLYELPILNGIPVNQLTVKIKVNGVPAQQLRLQSAQPNVRLYNLGQDGILEWQQQALSAKGSTLKLAIPLTQGDKHSYSYHQDQWYFSSQVKLPANWLAQTQPRNIKSLNLVWDASGSGRQRDINKELSLLSDFFKSVGEVTVNLRIARDQAEKVRQFQIRQGNWQELRQVLEQSVFDGATKADALLPDRAADLTLIFSDGLINYGAATLAASFAKFSTPVFTINSNPQADTASLRAIAEQNGGELLPLQQLQTAQALRKILTIAPYVQQISSDQASDIIVHSMHPENGSLRFSGKLNGKQAQLRLRLKLANGKEFNHLVQLNAPAQATHLFAAQSWAQASIEKLAQEPSRHRQAIRQLAQNFNLLSSETSLLVLDDVSDYVRYEITPPAPLLAEYQRRLSQQLTQKKQQQQDHLEQLAERFNQVYRWWQTEFPKNPETKPKRRDSNIARNDAVSSSSHSIIPPSPQAEVPMARPVAAMPAPAPAMLAESTASPMATPIQDSAHSSSIQLQAWRADESYLQRLRSADPADRYAIYLDEKLSHQQSTAFYLDVADFFIDQNQLDLGLRILSNLAEMQLENRQILRVLAYRLVQAKRADLALPILQRVSILSPNEPQSFRDLALAYAELQNYAAAIEQFWYVASRKWDPRFPNIDLICLSEMNALIARVQPGQSLNLKQVDARFIKSMPLDLRAVLSWDADNTDIDLHVTDPNGQTVYYGQPQSRQGGRISSDFTQGYGPETFSLRNAIPGVYKVYARFYGHRQQIISPSTSVMLTLSTDFGRPQQRDESVVLRLKNAGDQVFVGEITLGEKDQTK